MPQKKVIFIYGPYGSGKTTIEQSLLTDPDLQAYGGLIKPNRITTRPLRSEEAGGSGVRSVSEEEFRLMEQRGETIAPAYISTSDGGYHNALSTAELTNEKIPVVDMYKEGLPYLENYLRTQGYEPDVFKVYVHASEADRKNRIQQRSGKRSGEQNLQRDVSPVTPFNEKDADLVIENRDGEWERTRDLIKFAVLNFLERKEPQEMKLELRKK